MKLFTFITLESGKMKKILFLFIWICAGHMAAQAGKEAEGSEFIIQLPFA